MAEETEEKKKVVFKTEEDRHKAIQDLGEAEDVPAGVDRDEYTKEFGVKLEEMMKAPLDPETPAEDAPPVETPPETPPEPPPEEPPPAPDATALQHQLNEERIGRQSMVLDHEKAQREMEAKIEELQKKIETPPATDTPQPDAFDSKIADAKKEIARIEEEMNGIEETDYEKKSELGTKIAIQSSRLTFLLDDRQRETQKKYDQSEKALREENEKRVDAEKRRTAKDEEDRKRTENRKTLLEEADSFRSQHPEFQGKKTYEQMEMDHYEFSKKIASRYHGIPTHNLTASQREVAMKRWLEKTPALMEKIKDVAVPVDLDKFLLLSDVQLTRMGTKVDPYTGDYVKETDAAGNRIVLPDMDTAYDLVKKKRGITAQEITDMAKKTAEEVKKAIDHRVDPREIDEPHKNANLGEMSLEDADRIIMDYDEEGLQLAARQAVLGGKELPEKVQHVNQALAKRGLRSITGRD